MDPYRSIARFFPALDAILDVFLRKARNDLIGFFREQRLEKILDLGCGAGGLSRILADHGFSSSCLDISESMLERAERVSRREPRFSVVHSTGGRLPFATEFDASVMRFVLHEMSPGTRVETLRELNRVIRPGGFMVFIDFVRPPDMDRIYARFGSFIIRFIESRMTSIHAPHYENFSALMGEGGTLRWLEARYGTPYLFKSYFGDNIGLVCIRKAE